MAAAGGSARGCARSCESDEGRRRPEWSRCGDFFWGLDLRDASGVREGEAGYDPRTIQVPRSVWPTLSETQRSYWRLKQDYFNVVLLYEAGTFYHAYEFDAQVLVTICGLNYTRPPAKGQIRCAGVPIAHANAHIATLLREGARP